MEFNAGLLSLGLKSSAILRGDVGFLYTVIIQIMSAARGCRLLLTFLEPPGSLKCLWQRTPHGLSSPPSPPMFRVISRPVLSAPGGGRRTRVASLSSRGTFALVPSLFRSLSPPLSLTLPANYQFPLESTPRYRQQDVTSV
ncbi:unnamed protein product [Pleuronectes platessa]|uniref:Uncharacterized protein n=1 Tax=Pleuronectes platessa TaxID=8262 RepID=A0A9N7VDC0_PLEPL|nr:unnamed protein product [Pleuronectes platessa]